MKPKRILITGASGFVGRHMAALLVGKGYEVFGLDREIPLEMPEGIQSLVVDLEDSASMVALPRDWSGVIHLAGASIPSLFATTAPVVSNLHITLNLLEHLQSATVLLISSCHVYAPSRERHKEDDPIVPQGRYGLSKHLLEQVVTHYRPKLDLRVARPFNHLGPGQRPELVIPSLLRQLAQLPKHDPEPVKMHGMNSVRDFIDIHDVVAAYLTILELENPAHHIFNVCNGIGYSIENVVQTVLELLGSQREVLFSCKPNSLDDIPCLVGDSSRLQACSTWHPQISMTDSLSTMLKIHR